MTDLADVAFRVNSNELLTADRRMESLDRSSVRAEGSSGRLTRRFVALGAAATTAGIAGLSVLAKKTSDYVGALAEVSTLVDTSSFDMAAISRSALEQARIFGAMPTTQVAAFYQAISAGAGTAESATDLLTTANKLAVAGVTTVDVAVDGLTSVMNAYGKEAGTATEVSEAMFVAVRAGKTDVALLSTNIGKLAPIASTAGVSLNDVLAATAALTKGGVPTSTAMDGIRAAIASVIKPSSQAAAAAAEMGIDFNVAALESKGLAGFLNDVAIKTGGSTEKMALLFGGVEALTPVLTLTGKAADDFAEIIGDLGDKTGILDEAFDKMALTPGFQMNRITATLAAGFISLGTAITIGSVPALTAIADTIPIAFAALQYVLDTVTLSYTTFMNALANNGSWPFVALREVNTLLGNLGDFLRPILPYVVQFGVALVAIGAAHIALSLTGTALLFIAGGIKAIALAAMTINPITAAILAVGAAALVIEHNWEGISKWWAGMWDEMEKRLDEFLKMIATWPGKLIASITSKANSVKNAFLSWFDLTPSILDETVGHIPSTIADIITGGPNLGLMEIAGAELPMAVARGFKEKENVPIIMAFEAGNLMGKGMTSSIATSVANGKPKVTDAVIDVVDDSVKAFDQIMSGLNKQVVAFTGVTAGARKYGDQWDRLTQTQQDSINGQEAIIKTLKDEKKLRDEIGGAITQSILDASNIKEAFENLGDFMKSWLKKQAAEFASNKLMVAIGFSDAGGINGNVISQLFNGGSSGSSGSGGFGGFAGFGGGSSQALNAGSTSFYGAAGAGTPSGAGMLAANGGLVATAGTVLAMAAAANEIGKAVGRLLNASDPENAGIGSILGGPMGTVVGSIMGAGWQRASSGLSVGVANGNVNAQSYEHLRTNGGAFGGTRNIHNLSELDAQTETAITGYFENLNTSIVDQATALGVSGADSILSGFNMATQIFTGGTANEDLQEWLEESTREAYALAFNNMSPELAAHMNSAVDIVNDSVIEIAAVFESTALGFAAVNDAATILGLNFDSLDPSAVGASDALIELMGGLDQFQSATQRYYNEYYTLEERQRIALAEAAIEVAGFNAALNANGVQSITSRDQFMQLVEGLDLSTEAGRALWAQAMDVSGSFAAVADSTQNMDEIIAALPGNLQGSFSEMRTAANNTAGSISSASSSLFIFSDSINKAGRMAAAEVSRISALGRQANPNAVRDTMAMAIMNERGVTFAQAVQIYNGVYDGSAAARAAARATAARAAAAAAAARVPEQTTDHNMRIGDIQRLVESQGISWTAAANQYDGSHFNGIKSVPFDNYRAVLHEGEGVLTKRENQKFNSSSENVVELKAIVSGQKLAMEASKKETQAILIALSDSVMQAQATTEEMQIANNHSKTLLRKMENFVT
jgi:TP901 family phage tail tape measure protein